jgi:flagellar FliL protein
MARPIEPGTLFGDAMAAKANVAAAAPEVEADEEAPAAKRKLPLKLIIIAAAALVVVAGGGTGAYLALSGGSKEKTQEAKGQGSAPRAVAFLDLPDMLVNLSGTGERTQYLKMKIVLEVPDQALIAQIQPVMPRVMDAFQTYLRELRASDLEGSAGLYRLKEELTRRVNAAIEPARINAVLFKELLVQ